MATPIEVPFDSLRPGLGFARVVWYPEKHGRPVAAEPARTIGARPSNWDKGRLRAGIGLAGFWLVLSVVRTVAVH